MATKVSSPNWLTIGQAAKYLGVSPDTLRRWGKKGKLKAYRTPGGRRRYTQYDLELAMRPQPKPLSLTRSTPQQTRPRPSKQLPARPAVKAPIQKPSPPPRTSHPSQSKSRPVKPSAPILLLLIAVASLLILATSSGLAKRLLVRLKMETDIIKPIPESYSP